MRENKGGLVASDIYSYEKFLLSTENCAEIILFYLNYYLVVVNMALQVLFLQVKQLVVLKKKSLLSSNKLDRIQSREQDRRSTLSFVFVLGFKC